MSPEEAIEALDEGLAESGETIELWRPDGAGGYAKVICAAKVTGVSVEEIAAGIQQADLNVIISPTEITAAGWPNAAITTTPPFSPDPRLPQMDVDKAVVQCRMRTVVRVDPVFMGDALVRINMRVTG